MIDHIGIKVKDSRKSRAFYEKALSPLGCKVLKEFGEYIGFGSEAPVFWLYGGESGTPVHVAFASPDRAGVDAFYEAAIEAGGVDNGPPGIREKYHPNYYGAFVLDPDGHNVEAVCHQPE
jgi:catechol 2,3-dioxygenase-like lactoylglutathione lyase family enzyme